MFINDIALAYEHTLRKNRQTKEHQANKKRQKGKEEKERRKNRKQKRDSKVPRDILFCLQSIHDLESSITEKNTKPNAATQPQTQLNILPRLFFARCSCRMKRVFRVPNSSHQRHRASSDTEATNASVGYLSDRSSVVYHILSTAFFRDKA